MTAQQIDVHFRPGWPVTDADIDRWEALRDEGMISALGEYTPDEFWLLLDEVKRLRAALRQSGEAVRRDREADRARFGDAAFNEWLDTGISDAGHIVWDAIGDTQAAWAGWEARQFAGDAVLLTKCCGREECGGECGNSWLGMDMYRKPTAPPATSGLVEALRDALEAGDDGDWQSARNVIHAALAAHDARGGK